MHKALWLWLWLWLWQKIRYKYGPLILVVFYLANIALSSLFSLWVADWPVRLTLMSQLLSVSALNVVYDCKAVLGRVKMLILSWMMFLSLWASGWASINNWAISFAFRNIGFWEKLLWFIFWIITFLTVLFTKIVLKLW